MGFPILVRWPLYIDSAPWSVDTQDITWDTLDMLRSSYVSSCWLQIPRRQIGVRASATTMLTGLWLQCHMNHITHMHTVITAITQIMFGRGLEVSSPLVSFPDSKVHGAHLGPTGPRWAPCWPHELCYLGCYWLVRLLTQIQASDQCLAEIHFGKSQRKPVGGGWGIF